MRRLDTPRPFEFKAAAEAYNSKKSLLEIFSLEEILEGKTKRLDHASELLKRDKEYGNLSSTSDNYRPARKSEYEQRKVRKVRFNMDHLDSTEQRSNFDSEAKSCSEAKDLKIRPLRRKNTPSNFPSRSSEFEARRKYRLTKKLEEINSRNQQILNDIDAIPVADVLERRVRFLEPVDKDTVSKSKTLDKRFNEKVRGRRKTPRPQALGDIVDEMSASNILDTDSLNIMMQEHDFIFSTYYN